MKESLNTYLWMINWFGVPEQPKYDFNNDCIINMADLAMFMDGWMECGLL